MRSHFGPSWQRAACAALAALIAGVSHAHMNTAPRIDQGEMFVPRPEAARLWALGFDAVVSDYYWIRALQVRRGHRADQRREPAWVLPPLGRDDGRQKLGRPEALERI